MFNTLTQTLAINMIDFPALDLYPIGKHTFVLKAPHKTDRRGIVIKFQRGRIPQPGDVVHVTLLADDESRVGFERQVVAIQRKHAGYTMRMDCPPELRMIMDDVVGYRVGYALHVEGDSKTVLNKHSLVW